MAKPKPELAQRCPPPPYTRWDQRGKPVLLSYLKLIDRRRPVSALFSAWLLRPPSAGLSMRIINSGSTDGRSILL